MKVILELYTKKQKICVLYEIIIQLIVYNFLIFSFLYEDSDSSSDDVENILSVTTHNLKRKFSDKKLSDDEESKFNEKNNNNSIDTFAGLPVNHNLKEAWSNDTDKRKLDRIISNEDHYRDTKK